MPIILKILTSRTGDPTQCRLTVNGLSHDTPPGDIHAINREASKLMHQHICWQFTERRLQVVVPNGRVTKTLKALRQAVAIVTRKNVTVHYMDGGTPKVIKADGSEHIVAQNGTNTAAKKPKLPPRAISWNDRQARLARHNR